MEIRYTASGQNDLSTKTFYSDESGFEVASVAILIFFKVTPEAAISGTLILRGLTLWLPLIPGLYFARHHLSFKKQSKAS